MLGVREPDLYGKRDYSALVEFVEKEAARRGIHADCFQSNSEGEIVTEIQNALGTYDAIVINAADLTDISAREEFRRFSYVSLYANKTICGKGFDGYAEALDVLLALSEK